MTCEIQITYNKFGYNSKSEITIRFCERSLKDLKKIVLDVCIFFITKNFFQVPVRTRRRLPFDRLVSFNRLGHLNEFY